MPARQWPALPGKDVESLARWAQQITQLFQTGVLAQSGELGTLAQQDADDVAITGGTIDGVDITGSTIDGDTPVSAAAALVDDQIVVGDGGSGGVKTIPQQTPLPPNGDFDDVTHSGFNRSEGSETNAPANFAAVLTAMRSSTRFAQLGFTTTGTLPLIYMRHAQVGTTITAWHDVPVVTGGRGSSGQVLTSNGTSAAPSFGDIQKFDLIAEGSGTTSTNIDMSLGGNPSVYDWIEICVRMRPTADVSQLGIRFSVDNASSYLSGASDYASETDTTRDAIYITPDVSFGSGTDEGVLMRLLLMDFNQDSVLKRLIGNIGYARGDGIPRESVIEGRLNSGASTNDVTHVRIFPTSSNWAIYKYQVIGHRH